MSVCFVERYHVCTYIYVHLWSIPLSPDQPQHSACSVDNDDAVHKNYHVHVHVTTGKNLVPLPVCQHLTLCLSTWPRPEYKYKYKYIQHTMLNQSLDSVEKRQPTQPRPTITSISSMTHVICIMSCHVMSCHVMPSTHARPMSHGSYQASLGRRTPLSLFSHCFLPFPLFDPPPTGPRAHPHVATSPADQARTRAKAHCCCRCCCTMCIRLIG